MRPLLTLLSPGGSNACLSILIWHRVLPEQDVLFPEEMYGARFDATLNWIKTAFNVLPLPEAATRLREGTLPSRALAITFDDGYQDNYSVALPLLEKYRLPATFFIATRFLDGGRMWNDTLVEAVRHAPAGRFDGGAFGRFDLGDAGSRRQAIDALINQIKYLDLNARLEAVDVLAQKAGVEIARNLMMTKDQVRVLHRSGMTIGAHTCSHPILAKLSLDDAATEIAQGRSELEEIIGNRVTLFAYPNGKPNQDYRYEHVELVKSLGFEAAVSTAWGGSRHGDDLFQLRRFSPWDTGRNKFMTRMAMNLLRSQRTYPICLPPQ